MQKWIWERFAYAEKIQAYLDGMGYYLYRKTHKKYQQKALLSYIKGKIKGRDECAKRKKRGDKKGWLREEIETNGAPYAAKQFDQPFLKFDTWCESTKGLRCAKKKWKKEYLKRRRGGARYKCPKQIGGEKRKK